MRFHEGRAGSSCVHEPSPETSPRLMERCTASLAPFATSLPLIVREPKRNGFGFVLLPGTVTERPAVVGVNAVPVSPHRFASAASLARVTAPSLMLTVSAPAFQAPYIVSRSPSTSLARIGSSLLGAAATSPTYERVPYVFTGR